MDVVLCRGGGRLQTLVLTRDIDSLNKFLNNGYDVNNFNRYGETALYVASYYGDLDIVDLLLSKGADPNLYTMEGNTPLHAAAYRERMDVMQKLIDSGAKEHLKNEHGFTASDLKLKHSQETHESYDCTPKRSFELKKLYHDLDRKRRPKLFRNGVEYFTPFCAFTFDHLQIMRALVTSIPVNSFSELEEDPRTSLHSDNCDFFIRDRKLWHGGISVLMHQINRNKLTPVRNSDIKSKVVIQNLIIRELEVCSRIHHPNIISLLAIIYDTVSYESSDQSINPDNMALIYEYPCLGTMYDYIQINRNNLSTLSALVISCQISEALIFLHSSGIVHCGVTPYSVHLYALDRAKLGNFEYAQYIQSYEHPETGDHYYSDDCSMRKCKSSDHQRSSCKLTHLPSIYNLLFGAYYLPPTRLTDWLPPELYDPKNKLFNLTDFSSVFQSVSIEEIRQTIKPCTASDVFSLGKLVYFALPVAKENYQDNIAVYNAPSNPLALVSSAVQCNADERLPMKQFNRLLIHLFWVEYDREKSPKGLFENIPPCPLRLCDHKWKPRYSEPVPILYTRNPISNPFPRTISPIHGQALNSFDNERKMNKRMEKSFSCTHRSLISAENSKSITNSSNPSASTKMVNISGSNQSDSRLLTKNSEKLRLQLVKRITNRSDNRPKKGHKRSWHKMFTSKKRLTSTKQDTYESESKEKFENSNSSEKKKKPELQTSSQPAVDCGNNSDRRVKVILSNTENEKNNSRLYPSFTDWLTRRRNKLPDQHLSPDINIKLQCDADSTPVARAEMIPSNTSNYLIANLSPTNSSRKSYNLSRRFRLTKSEYVHLAAVPLLPDGVEVNHDLVTRREQKQMHQTPVSHSIPQCMNNQPVLPLDDSVRTHTDTSQNSQGISPEIVCSKLNAYLNRPTNLKFELNTPVKPASHITQVLSSSVENPYVSGRIDLIRTSSFLARKRRYLNQLRTSQELLSFSAVNSFMHSKNHSFRMSPDPHAITHRRVNSFPTINTKPTVVSTRSRNHDASVQTDYSTFHKSFHSDNKTELQSYCSGDADTVLRRNSPYQRVESLLKKSSIKFNEKGLFDVRSIIQKYESYESTGMSSHQISPDVITSGQLSSKYSRISSNHAVMNKSLLANSYQANNHNINEMSKSTQCETNVLSSPWCASLSSKTSIGIQCNIFDESSNQMKQICNASVQTEMNDVQQLHLGSAELCTVSKNQIPLPINREASGSEMTISSSDDFFNLPKPGLNSSLRRSSELNGNQNLCKPLSNSMLEINNFTRFLKPLNSKWHKSASFHFDKTKTITDRHTDEGVIFPHKIQSFHYYYDISSSYGSFPTPPVFQEEKRNSSKVKSDDEYHNFLNIPLSGTISSCKTPDYRNQSILYVESSESLFHFKQPSPPPSSSACQLKRTPLSEIHSNGGNCQYSCQNGNKHITSNKQLPSPSTSFHSSENLPPVQK
ncbi:unnamed protein product [Heterobilharzia americana]|nr:unnamed protein product [Heterobilharzia americana]